MSTPDHIKLDTPGPDFRWNLMFKFDLCLKPKTKLAI